MNSIKLDHGARSAIVEGESIRLTRREFSLLEFFLNNTERIISRKEINDAVFDGSGTNAAIRATLSRLRNRIGHNYISTLRGQGWSLSVSPIGYTNYKDIYIMSLGYSNLYKIGYGKATERLKIAKGFNPLLKLVAFGKTAYPTKVEYVLHRLFRDCHISNEVFRLDRTQYQFASDIINRLCYDDWFQDKHNSHGIAT